MFEQAVKDHGWMLCRNEGTVEEATMLVVSRVYEVLGLNVEVDASLGAQGIA
jgi:hypothetical protein